MELQQRIREAGVVGAGGAGFPAHVKAGARADIVIANGAECEPLLHKDLELMVHFPEQVIAGLELLRQAVGASRAIVGVKSKNAAAIAALTTAINDPAITLHELGDFYPSGDEFVLVYEATGRLIPPRGYPPDIGIVVQNVETLANIAAAAEGVPVVEKCLTVAGAVREPMTFVAPVGTSYRDVIARAGGATVADFSLFVSGVMMGQLTDDLDAPVTKTCAGLVVLPRGHQLVSRMTNPEPVKHRIGKSGCDQCCYCTELCPRYILGYDVQPHKVMRALSFNPTGSELWNNYSVLCCACGLCTLYACPEFLFPKEACDRGKRDLREQGIEWSGRTEVTPHPMYEFRRTPLTQLVQRLDLARWDVPAPFAGNGVAPARVTIPLAQHLGAPAEAVVAVGERVARGQLVGEIPSGALGARVHASIAGTVAAVGKNVVIESE